MQKHNKIKYRPLKTYITPGQYNKIVEIQEMAMKLYGVKLSIAEIVRDCIDGFIATDVETVGCYLQYKGWI